MDPLSQKGTYLDLLFEVSMRKMGCDPVLSRRIAMALARNLGTSATLKTLCVDASAGDRPPAQETISAYLAVAPCKGVRLWYHGDEIYSAW